MVRTPSLAEQIDGLDKELDAIVGPLSGEELLSLTAVAIREHRKLLNTAELAFQEFAAAKAKVDPDPKIVGSLQASYLEAMKRNNSQLMLVASLTDRLGYIPDVDALPNIDN